MTTDTKIILRELAIIHTTLKIIMEQQEAIADRVLGPVEKAKFQKAYSESQIAETIDFMKQRLAKHHNLFQTYF